MRYGLRYELRFGLLGPPVLYDADGEVRPIGSGKMRALLAALLLEPGRVVSVDALKDALWGGAPPASAQASLQNHVTRLRRLLGDDPERLRAVPPGYLLRVGEGELDVRVFEDHVAAARAAHAGGDWERTARECAAALALWRGTPLSGLPPETGGHALVQRLEEARLLAREWGFDAELHLGGARLAALVPELAALVAEYPLREAFHRLLMLVLHGTGRQAEALAVHRDLRARLIEELGVEPGSAVREAHLKILREGACGAGETQGCSGGGAALGGPAVVPDPGEAGKDAGAYEAGEGSGEGSDEAGKGAGEDSDGGTARAAVPAVPAVPAVATPPRPAQLPPRPPTSPAVATYARNCCGLSTQSAARAPSPCSAAWPGSARARSRCTRRMVCGNVSLMGSCTSTCTAPRPAWPRSRRGRHSPRSCGTSASRPGASPNIRTRRPRCCARCSHRPAP
ncbi:hypothetical protein SAV14893_041070 [Streptomyces avermitilis]|uniref:OmpR/PhoB-type domain-containing protein n=1 Tax=Streptomyces avermitilis TaxID=33903 RepID=A0A4D4LW63_STRAX|nr:hypothetical protein SAV14893_041070 [Streptomyces avermitilis]